MALTRVNYSRQGNIPTSKLTGALPAIDGSALTNLVGGLTYNGGTTLANLRIQTGTATLPGTSNDTGANPGWGPGARDYSDVAVTLTGFASTPTIFAYSGTNYHETVVCSSLGVTSSSATFRAHSSRTGGLHNATIYYLAIGEAS